MRYSRFSQSYSFSSPSLEVSEAEMFDRSLRKSWTCKTIEQMGIPQAKISQGSQSVTLSGSLRSEAVRRSHSVKDLHRVTMHRNVARRMESAKQRGDKTLLRALEAELRELILV